MTSAGKFGMMRPMSDFDEMVWEQRWHPFRGEWVLYTSHRSGRPWVGEHVGADAEDVPSYDPECALCPGNKRVRGENPDYQEPYWFTNDLPTFGDHEPSPNDDPLYARRPASGTAEVVCYHPDHSKTFSGLTPEEASAVVRLWRERYVALAARPDVDHVLIFENKGRAVGTSNPHPHCQIYAGNLVYGHIQREVEMARAYFEKHQQHLGMAVLEREAGSGREICGNESFVACVPWFARYAYEVMILPRRPMASLADFREEEIMRLAELMIEVAVRYDNLWKMPLPYVMAFHQAPTDDQDYHFYPFHIEFHPPLRNPDTMKYLAGPEIGGGSMTNESNPDLKAAELKAVPAVHYRNRKHGN